MQLCACGCGEKAIYAARHVCTTIRTRITEDDYVELACGYQTPCWIWKGRREGTYANVRIRGTQMSVHRAMFLQEVGLIPSGAVIDHLCEQKRCLRPDHLALSTIGENVRRSVGFNPDAEALREILSGRVPLRALAVKHGVSTRTISKARRRHQQPT